MNIFRKVLLGLMVSFLVFSWVYAAISSSVASWWIGAACPANYPDPISLCWENWEVIVIERDENDCAIKYGCESNEVTPDCIRWYDGCNDCSKTDYWTMCTERYCTDSEKTEPKCYEYKKEEPRICTMEYAPVCWDKDWVKKTYSNKCMLEWAWAEYLYKWRCGNPEPVVCTEEAKVCSDGSTVVRVGPNCEFTACPWDDNSIPPVTIWGDKDEHGCYISAWYSWCEVKNKCIRSWEEECETELPKVCTMEYAPVCWVHNSKLKTFSNKCMLEWVWARYFYEWECKIISPLSSTLRVKSDILIRKFVNKIEERKLSNTKNVEVINNIIDKLNGLKEGKPKLNDIINYLVKKLEIQLEKYSDFSEIESIFNNN